MEHSLSRQFTAVYKKTGSWYACWVEEIPGVNSQGKTLVEAKANLKEALILILETNRLLSNQSVGRTKVLRESLLITA